MARNIWPCVNGMTRAADIKRVWRNHVGSNWRYIACPVAAGIHSISRHNRCYSHPAGARGYLCRITFLPRSKRNSLSPLLFLDVVLPGWISAGKPTNPCAVVCHGFFRNGGSCARVDDHARLRKALRTVLEISGELHVCGEAADGTEAIERLEN
jgi:hypothetical protein